MLSAFYNNQEEYNEAYRLHCEGLKSIRDQKLLGNMLKDFLNRKYSFKFQRTKLLPDIVEQEEKVHIIIVNGISDERLLWKFACYERGTNPSEYAIEKVLAHEFEGISFEAPIRDENERTFEGMLTKEDLEVGKGRKKVGIGGIGFPLLVSLNSKKYQKDERFVVIRQNYFMPLKDLNDDTLIKIADKEIWEEACWIKNFNEARKYAVSFVKDRDRIVSLYDWYSKYPHEEYGNIIEQALKEHGLEPVTAQEVNEVRQKREEQFRQQREERKLNFKK